MNPPTFSTNLFYMRQGIAEIGQWIYLLYGRFFKLYYHSYLTNGRSQYLSLCSVVKSDNINLIGRVIERLVRDIIQTCVLAFD